MELDTVSWDITAGVNSTFKKWLLHVPVYNTQLREHVDTYPDRVFTYEIESLPIDKGLGLLWWTDITNVRSYNVIVTCPTADKDNEVEAECKLYRHRDGDTWRFSIIADWAWISPRTGFARLILTILVYKMIDIFDHHATIGICADASLGFWEYIGMRKGRFSEEGARAMNIHRTNEQLMRYDNSISRQMCGYDLEFTFNDLLEFIGYHRKRKRS